MSHDLSPCGLLSKKWVSCNNDCFIPVEVYSLLVVQHAQQKLEYERFCCEEIEELVVPGSSLWKLVLNSLLWSL